jgi:hypothetical protein
MEKNISHGTRSWAFDLILSSKRAKCITDRCKVEGASYPHRADEMQNLKQPTPSEACNALLPTSRTSLSHFYRLCCWSSLRRLLFPRLKDVIACINPYYHSLGSSRRCLMWKIAFAVPHRHFPVSSVVPPSSLYKVLSILVNRHTIGMIPST